MAKQRLRDTTNPLKAQGSTKARTRARADRADPRGFIADKNSLLDRLLRPGDTAHASQQGGVTALRPGRIADASVRKGKTAGAKQPGTGLVKGGAGSRSRAGKSRDGNRSRRAVRSLTGTRKRAPHGRSES
jgi:multidrug resistance efflux pump